MNMNRLGGPKNRAFATHAEAKNIQSKQVMNGYIQNHFVKG
jgi:hypothetical protein